MNRTDAFGSAATLVVSAGAAVSHSAEVTARQIGAMPIEPIECWYAAFGGLVAGIVLERFAQRTRLREIIVAVITSALLAFAFGPLVANGASTALPYVVDGLYENIAAGAAVGIVGIFVLDVLSTMLADVKREPGGSIGALMKLLRAITGRK